MEFKIYKRGQGYYTRLWGAIMVSVVVVIGSWVLHKQLLVFDNPWVEMLIPAGVCVVFGALIAWISNRASMADFMISAEGEIKKVSWSSRKEIVVSTIIVMIVVAVMAGMMRLTDFIFGYLFQEVLNINNVPR